MGLPRPLAGGSSEKSMYSLARIFATSLLGKAGRPTPFRVGGVLPLPASLSSLLRRAPIWSFGLVGSVSSKGLYPSIVQLLLTWQTARSICMDKRSNDLMIASPVLLLYVRALLDLAMQHHAIPLCCPCHAFRAMPHVPYRAVPCLPCLAQYGLS